MNPGFLFSAVVALALGCLALPSAKGELAYYSGSARMTYADGFQGYTRSGGSLLLVDFSTGRIGVIMTAKLAGKNRFQVLNNGYLIGTIVSTGGTLPLTYTVLVYQGTGANNADGLPSTMSTARYVGQNSRVDIGAASVSLVPRTFTGEQFQLAIGSNTDSTLSGAVTINLTSNLLVPNSKFANQNGQSFDVALDAMRNYLFNLGYLEGGLL